MLPTVATGKASGNRTFRFPPVKETSSAAPTAARCRSEHKYSLNPKLQVILRIVESQSILSLTKILEKN
jgi:hypothetical protein